LFALDTKTIAVQIYWNAGGNRERHRRGAATAIVAGRKLASWLLAIQS
jgi:hypothetical protein